MGLEPASKRYFKRSALIDDAVNESFSFQVENFDSSLSQVMSTSDETNRDLKDLKNTVSKVTIMFALSKRKKKAVIILET